MGQKQTKTRSSRVEVASNPFKLFDYCCPSCNAKRPIQYFHRNDTFLPQAPRVVCGECNTSVAVEPFKTVDYSCPWCKKWHKARLPGKPIPIKMYNMSVASCNNNCGFRGEVPVGKLMDVSCSQCWSSKRELRGVWTEHNDEVKTFCDTCNSYQRAYAREPKKKAAEKTLSEYECENCHRHNLVEAEELLKNQGLAICAGCGWVGYPAEVVPQGQLAAKSKESKEPKASKNRGIGVKTRPNEKSRNKSLPPLENAPKMPVARGDGSEDFVSAVPMAQP